MADIDTSVLSCHVTNEMANMPEIETEEWFLSCIAPVCLFIKALFSFLLVCYFPLEQLLG